MRILKTVKEYGSTAISTSTQTLDTQTVKGLGDVISYHVTTSLTTVGGTGTELADGTNYQQANSTSAYKGASVARLFRRIKLSDNNNTDLTVIEKDDLWRIIYLLSLVNADDFLFNRGLNEEPATVAADATATINHFIVPQSIGVADLPATLEIELGTLSDFYSTVGTGTATINEFTVVVRYVPPKASAITLRIKAFNITAFSADTDISHLLPDGIKIHILAYIPFNSNANGGEDAQDDLTRVDRLAFRRGSNEEIENIRRSQVDHYINVRYDGARPDALTVIPTDSFEKTDSSKFEYDVNGQIAPRIFYVYQ